MQAYEMQLPEGLRDQWHDYERGNVSNASPTTSSSSAAIGAPLAVPSSVPRVGLSAPPRDTVAILGTREPTGLPIEGLMSFRR